METNEKPITQYQQRHKYFKENRENLNINLAKGTKEIWKSYAEDRGLTLTQYITKLIEEDNKED